MISVEHLSYRYPGADQPAIRDVSFNIAAGEVFGFLGPSGAGKSTTQKVLTGLLPGFSGEARVLDRDLRDWRRQDYEKIGVSFELPIHYPKLTARENLGFFAALYRGTCETPAAALAMVGLEGDADRRAEGFSKGMAGRLNIARALINRPELIFLDEPTGGLDPVNVARIADLVLRLKREGRTVFVTTHDMHFAERVCDRVGFMLDGELAVVDAPRALKLRGGARLVRVERQGDHGLEAEEFPLDGLSENAEFLAFARPGIETIHSREAGLDDVFRQVTGRSLASGEPA